jgi:hypothetical protein
MSISCVKLIQDTIVPEARTLQLMQSCLNPEVLRHPGGMTSITLSNVGHFIPTASNYIADITRFVEKHLPAEGGGNPIGET